MNNMIYRQMAIAIIKDCMLDPDDCRYENAEEINGVLRFAKDKIKEVPSAQRTGRWIPVAGRMGKEVQCDCCGEVFWYWLTNFTYCPNCGAEMEVEHE